MKKFVTKVIDMMKDEKMFANQGGPIILAQVPIPQLIYHMLNLNSAEKRLWSINIYINYRDLFTQFILLQIENEYNHIKEPKWSHLKDTHKAINFCKKALFAATPTVTKPNNIIIYHCCGWCIVVGNAWTKKCLSTFYRLASLRSQKVVYVLLSWLTWTSKTKQL